MTGQIRSVGTIPTSIELFVGALLYGTVDEARDVLRFVEDSDVDEPSSTVLAAVRALALRGTPPGPQLVTDELRRRGKLTRSVAVWLNGATTSGACPSAAKQYAAAAVSERLRQLVESFGTGLTSMSASVSEADVLEVVDRAATRIRGIAARLSELRGESL